MIATVAIGKINHREMSLDLYTEKSPEIIIVFSLWKGLIQYPVTILGNIFNMKTLLVYYET